MSPELHDYLDRLRDSAWYAGECSALAACVPLKGWHLLACDVLERALILAGAGAVYVESVGVVRGVLRGERDSAEVERVSRAMSDEMLAMTGDARGPVDDGTMPTAAVDALCSQDSFADAFAYAGILAALASLSEAREAAMTAAREDRLTPERPAALLAWETARAWPAKGRLPVHLVDASADLERSRVVGEPPAEIVYFMEPLEERLLQAEAAWQATFIAGRHR